MKKKNLFLGVLLASAVFSLAACGNGNGTTSSVDTTPTTSDTTPTTPTTSETTPTTPTSSDTTPTKDKFDVKYYAVIGDDEAVEIADAKQTVEEGSTTTAPEAKLAKDGYKIEGYYTNEALGDKFDFTTPITKTTKVYVSYKALTLYDTMAADPNKVVAYDFSDNPTISYTDTNFNSTTPTLKGTSADDVKVEQDAVTVAKNTFVVDFGGAKTTGVLTTYFEVTFNAVKTSEAWFQLDGSSATKTDTEVLAIRTSSGSKFAYRIDGGTDVASTLDITTNKTYKVLFTIDTADGKMSLKVDDTVLFENVDIAVNKINGLKFTAKNDGSSKKVIDSVVSTFVAKDANPLIVAKNTALKAIEDYEASAAYTGLTTKVKAAVDEKIAEFKKDIAAAETADATNTIKSNWDTFAAKAKYSVLVKAYTAASTPAADATDYEIVIIEDSTTEKETGFANAGFSGYILDAIYKDEAFATEATAADVASGATLYAKVHVATKVNITEFKGYEAEYNGWTVVAAGAQNISPTLGQTKDAEDAVSCPKLDSTSSVTSVAFGDTKSITLTMISSSTGTSNSVNVTVELLVKEGSEFKVVSSSTWSDVTSGKVSTSKTETFTSAETFNYVRIKFKDAKGDTTKNFGIYSITGQIDQ